MELQISSYIDLFFDWDEDGKLNNEELEACFESINESLIYEINAEVNVLQQDGNEYTFAAADTISLSIEYEPYCALSRVIPTTRNLEPIIIIFDPTEIVTSPKNYELNSFTWEYQFEYMDYFCRSYVSNSMLSLEI